MRGARSSPQQDGMNRTSDGFCVTIINSKEIIMKNSPQPSFLRTFLPLSVVLTLLGWGGITAVILNTLPTLGPRWLFFFLGVIALTGPFIPVTYYLNKRFPSEPPVEGMVIVRQALWVGVFGSTIAWLQLGRVLTPALGLIMAGVFVLIEFLLRLFERSRWNPEGDA
jgi:hypothetical protein